MVTGPKRKDKMEAVPALERVEMSHWARLVYEDKYAWKNEENQPTENWTDTAERVVSNVLGALGYTDMDREYHELIRLISERKFMPGGRFLAMAGREYHPTSNCFLLRCEDSREGWAEVVRKSILALSGGGGVGVVYSDVRPSGMLIHKTGGVATGPISPASMVNEVARHVMAGGNRRSALWGGLHWSHKDIFDWITIKDWSDEIKAAKAKDFNTPAPLDMTNISVVLDSEFFFAYMNDLHPKHHHAHRVYWTAVEHMLAHGEPGFSINVGQDADECLRNPCCEVTSREDSDICTLGSVNLSRISDAAELLNVIEYGTLFLLAGTVYSDTPYAKVEVVREKNRRIGLGLMGIHEWLLQRGYDYSVVPELKDWLDIYATSGDIADEWADKHDLAHPIKTRSIAPTGTIGTIAETTTGIEPVYCVAFKRRFLGKDNVWRHQYVIDPTAQRLKDEFGIDPDSIEDAYMLALTPEKRIRFQADIEEYVDMAVSSTINLPAPITDHEAIADFGSMLFNYLPRLRGLTVYPNGARAGQPLEASTYHEAINKVGHTFEEHEHECVGGICGI